MSPVSLVNATNETETVPTRQETCIDTQLQARIDGRPDWRLRLFPSITIHPQDTVCRMRTSDSPAMTGSTRRAAFHVGRSERESRARIATLQHQLWTLAATAEPDRCAA
jgi:hypothetical protein